MDIRKIGQGLLILGIFGVTVSLLVDLLPTAKAGVQSAQILGIEIATVVLLAGVWALLSERTEKIYPGRNIRDFFSQILDLPVWVWVLTGFLLTYILFFISPMFLNETHRVRYFINYLPDRFPIGNDMIIVIDLAKGWFFAGQSPYPVQFYPPLTYVLLAPLLLVHDYSILFTLFTFTTLVSYIILTLLLPAKMTGTEKSPLLLLFFITGLVSYGLQFELERGQFNVFTFLLCMISVYIYHYYPRYRILAYVLFSLSVQLKIYPAIFILMFVDDWRDWKTILLRFTGIAIFNFILLFAMGYETLQAFIASVFTQLSTPSQTWNGNHSIKSFVNTMTVDGFGIIGPDTLAIIRQNNGFIANALLLVVLACIIAGVWMYHSRRQKGLDTYLLLGCTIGALTIPVSNDYTLSILASPMALFLCNLAELKDSWKRSISILLVIGISFAYSSMLIPFKYKPYFMNNVFPPLLIILIITTCLNFMRYKNVDEDSLNF